MVLILFGIMGAKVEKGLGGLGLLIGAVVSLFAIYWALSPSLGFELPYWIQYNYDLIIALVVIIIIIALVIGGGSREGDQKSLEKVGGNLAKALFGDRN